MAPAKLFSGIHPDKTKKTDNVGINVILRRVRKTSVAVEKQCLANSDCVSVALVIQHGICLHRIMLSSVACPLYNMFPYFLINSKIFEKKFTEHKICVLIFSTSFV
jgi:hypothetical protein